MVRTTKSGSTGEFTAPLLLVGTYSITAEASGFQIKRIENIHLDVNATLSIPIALSPGSVSQSVTVTAANIAPNTISATASSLINGTQMRELSMNTRNFEQLLQLQPGISGSTVGQTRGIISTSGQTNQSRFSINGNAFNTNGYFLDGADILNHGGSAQVGVFTSVDAIQEQSVVRNAYDAQYGGSGSGIVTIQSKSGSAEFHGDAYEFFRNQLLNANDYFNNRVGIPGSRFVTTTLDIPWAVLSGFHNSAAEKDLRCSSSCPRSFCAPPTPYRKPSQTSRHKPSV